MFNWRNRDTGESTRKIETIDVEPWARGEAGWHTKPPMEPGFYFRVHREAKSYKTGRVSYGFSRACLVQVAHGGDLGILNRSILDTHCFGSWDTWNVADTYALFYGPIADPPLKGAQL